MAEQILFNIAERVLENIGLEVVNEAASALGFKTQLDKLNNTIKMIKDVLLDAEDRQFHSHAIHGWLERLTDVVYDADDLFDEFATVVSQWEAMNGNKLSKEVRIFFSNKNQIAFGVKMSHKIKNISDELQNIAEDGSKFGFVLRPQEEGVGLCKIPRDQTHSYIESEEVIGREHDKKAILDKILASSTTKQRITVVPIVGSGGLGKTTLAQLIYNDDKIVKQFPLRLWVCVSEPFEIKEIVKKILMSAKDVEPQNLDMDQLQGQLRKEISGRKYLLVLDDVWNEDKVEWGKLKNLLKFGGEGSKVLVTTRSWKVAQIMESTISPYGLRVLSEEESWTLFEKNAFELGEAQQKPHLVKMGKNIIKKCGAVPLAIKTLAATLCGEDERKWSIVEGSSLSELPEAEYNVMGVLKLSYDHLRSPLKNCFAYCALFPKDYTFQKETLINLWMAEGFTTPVNKSQDLEEVAEEYFEILLRRCFFQDVTMDEWGNIKACKMHDLMHDLSKRVARAKVTVAENDQDRNFNPKSRHLSFSYRLTSSWKYQSCATQAMIRMKHLRTILLPQQASDVSYMKAAILEQIISNFRCLRVLDLHSLGIKNLPGSIGKLIHLRYLDLSDNPMSVLPESITALLNLQTLKLCDCDKLEALPFSIRKLTNLRSLDLPRGMVYMPSGIGELTSLRKLTSFNLQFHNRFGERLSTVSKLKDLKNLDNLKGSLHILSRGDVKRLVCEPEEANLCRKHGLIKLELIFPGPSKEALVDPDFCDETPNEAIFEGLEPHPNLKILTISFHSGVKLPSWLTTLPNLVEIKLNFCKRCLQLPSFSQLPLLRCLKLEYLKSVEYIESGDSVAESKSQLSETLFFPALEKLRLSGMDNLKGWWKGLEEMHSDDQQETQNDSYQRYLRSMSFPKLTKLKITDCQNLESFPVCTIVETLSLKRVNRNLSSALQSMLSSKLKRLSIGNVEDLISLPNEHLNHLCWLEVEDKVLTSTLRLTEAFKSLSALRHLCFKNCRDLRSISQGLEHLSALETLTLSFCDELDLSCNGEVEEGMPWKALKTLHYLQFRSLKKLVNLPMGLQHLTNLRYLELRFIDNLIELPEWISCLSSLELIELVYCRKLKALPESIGMLTNLFALYIADCDGLTKRCRGPNGADWSKIQHIPDLIVKELLDTVVKDFLYQISQS